MSLAWGMHPAASQPVASQQPSFRTLVCLIFAPAAFLPGHPTYARSFGTVVDSAVVPTKQIGFVTFKCAGEAEAARDALHGRKVPQLRCVLDSLKSWSVLLLPLPCSCHPPRASALGCWALPLGVLHPGPLS